MTITVEAIYESGVLKPAQPLPLKEREKVQVTIHPTKSWVEETAGIIPCKDRELIDQIALDPDLGYSPLENL